MFITKILHVPCIVFTVFSLPLVAMDSRIVVTGGTSVGDGIATGRACIVAGLNELTKICKGDIVIASTTNDSWNKALKKSAGIITEDGGSNSHAALLGKKLGIPVMVGVKEATKKIIDGSSISFDCAKTIVYQIIEHVAYVKSDLSSFIMQGCNNYGSLLFGQQYQEYNDISDAINDRPTSEKKIKKVNVIKKENKHKHSHNFINSIDVTQERFQHDILKIKDEYIMKKVQNDIWKAHTVGEWLATRWITTYAYRSIPFEFYKDEKAIEKVFNQIKDRLEEAAAYVQDKKEIFKIKSLKNDTEINESELAQYSYHDVVDNIEVTDDLRKTLKDNPLQMDEYVRQGTVDRIQYTYYTFLNFAKRYYLEQELQKK